MQPRHFSFQTKPRLGFLIKLWYRLKRKPARPPSPTSITLADSDSTIQDATDSLKEKECTSRIVVTFDPDVWQEIFSYCEVIDIVRVGMTCRALASMTQDCQAWRSALLRISHDKRLPHLRARMNTLSSMALRQRAVLSARLDRLACGLTLIPSHYTTTYISLQTVLYVWAISFLPGGEWLVVLCRKAGESGVMICSTSDPLGQPATYSVVPGGQLTMRVVTGEGGKLLMVLSSFGPNGTTLGVYSIRHLESPPRLDRVWSTSVQEIEDFAAQGSYIVYGWIDRGHAEPTHFIRVLRFESSYRSFTEHVTMKAVWDTPKSHSYALRITDSTITVVVSSTSLVAAYEVPPMVSASSPYDPIAIEPFWRFPCGHMNPRGVYLVPSLPAVDTPSVTIIYRDRYLFVLPCFDSEPLGVHPTYLSTYKYPRELKRPMLLGPQRAFWDLGRGRIGIGALPTPSQPAFYEDGTWDLTGVNTPEADFANLVHPVVCAGSHSRKVARAAWDEESGKLALFPNVEFQQGEDMSITIVDFMH